MRAVTVAIIGGGPAGAACARTLVIGGVECLVLDKEVFPRSKVCAGWLTPNVFQDLAIDPDEYPYSLTTFTHLRIKLGPWPIILPGKQYAIRRIEFDDWLLKTSGAEVLQHEVRDIQVVSDRYLIDGMYSAEYLIGAGGTHCPVRRQLFGDLPVRKGSQILSLEEEFKSDWVDPSCRLWFFQQGLPGYAWYVPKKEGYVNIGIGANAEVLNKRGETIQDHWLAHVKMLIDLGKIEPRTYEPKGYTYYLRGDYNLAQLGKAVLVGDSLGLATLDMGEGIGPAIMSGKEAAQSIIEDRPFDLTGLPLYSLLPRGLGWLLNKTEQE